MLALGCALVLFASSPPVANGAFPGRNGRIAYAVEIGGGDGTDSTLYSVTPSGRRNKELEIGAFDPAYSADGRWLAFSSTSVPPMIRIVHASGRGRDRWLSSGTSPDWAPTPGRFVFEGQDELRIQRHRHRSRRLTSGAQPAWSSQNRIAFFRDDGLYVIRPDGTGLRRLSGHRAVRGGTQPDWSPDGRQIVFATVRGDIATIRADGARLRRLTRSGANSAPSYSPDGTRIVFGQGEYAASLVVMRTDGTEQRKVVAEVNGDSVDETDWQPLPNR